MLVGSKFQVGMTEAFLLRLATNAQEQVVKVYDDTLKSLSDPDYIDTEITRKLSDTSAEVIDSK